MERGKPAPGSLIQFGLPRGARPPPSECVGIPRGHPRGLIRFGPRHWSSLGVPVALPGVIPRIWFGSDFNSDRPWVWHPRRLFLGPDSVRALTANAPGGTQLARSGVISGARDESGPNSERPPCGRPEHKRRMSPRPPPRRCPWDPWRLVFELVQGVHGPRWGRGLGMSRARVRHPLSPGCSRFLASRRIPAPLPQGRGRVPRFVGRADPFR